MANLISIIVPIYNAAEHLENTLTSVAAQTLQNFEVIMIDDGSTDNSPEIAQSFQDRYPNFYLHRQTNGGVSSARNRGIELVKGKFLCFIDADDEMSAIYLEDFTKNYENERTLLVQDITRIGSTEEVPHYFGFSPETVALTDWHKLLSKKEFLIGYPFNKFFEAEIIKKHQLKFDKRVTMGEDKIFFTEYLKHVDFLKFLACSNYRYYFREGSAVTKKHNFQSNYLFLSNEAGFLKRISNNNLEALKKTYVYEKHSHFTVEAIRSIYRAGQPKSVRLSQLKQIYDQKLFTKINTVGKKNFLHFYLFHPSLFRLFDQIANIRFNVKK